MICAGSSTLLVRPVEREPRRSPSADFHHPGSGRLDYRSHVQGPSYGARPLRRAIQRYIEDPLSEELIRGHLRGGEIEVYLDAGALAYRPSVRSRPAVDWPEASNIL